MVMNGPYSGPESRYPERIKFWCPALLIQQQILLNTLDLVAQRLQRFVDIAGVERVAASSDCGFGTFAGYGAIDPDIAYAKLASLSEGAARVR